MRSVADIPPDDDAHDELSGISPELVLVDPELARLVRERETRLGAPGVPSPRHTPALRLVPAPAVEPPIVPAPAPSAPPPAVEEPEGSPAVDAEPGHAVHPPRRPIPPPLSDPARRPSVIPETPQARPVASALASAAESVMPHPVKRTSATPRPERAPHRKGRGRRVLALLAGVAAASVAVLAVLQVAGGPSEPTRTSAGPQAKSPVTGARQAASKPKAAAAPSRSETKTTSTADPAPRTTSKPSPGAKKPNTRTATAPAAASKPAAKSKPEKAAPATGTAGQVGASGAPPEMRRFAWAPVEGAIGYHVELFRGSERVLVKETKEAVLELGQTWRYQGRTLTLTPGEYRWYVWPVTKSGRATQAVVQAKLTV